MMLRALPLLALLSPASVLAGEKIFTGHYFEQAGAGLFEACLTGDRWPVAKEGAQARLQRLVAEKRKGEPLWAKVVGELHHELDLVKGTRRTYLVVNRVIESGARACEKKADRSLKNTQWNLVRLHGREVGEGARRKPYLMLRADRDEAAGYGGCNHFAGGYRLQGRALTFGPLGATRMACKTGYELEAAFFKALERTRSWRIRGDLLELHDGEGKPIARFVAASPH